MATKKLLKAKIEHDKFLIKMGVHPDQLKERKVKRGKLKLSFEGTADSYFERKSLCDVIQGNQTTGNKRDVISNIYKEDPHVQFQIRQKAYSVTSLVNKGGLQYITPESDPKTFGRK